VENLRGLAEEAHVMAPEHGRSTNGDIERRVPPWRIYSEEHAQTGLKYAEDAYQIADRFVKAWYLS